MENQIPQTGRILVLFDFDGTLARGNTLLRFLLFSVPPGKLVFGALALSLQYLLLFFRGKWENGRAKELLFRQYFRQAPQDRLISQGISFFRQIIPVHLKPDMIALLRAYRDSGAEVALVSASPDLWLAPFCNFEEIDCICTRLRYENGVFSGHFEGKNCNGAEKAHRVTARYNLKEFDKIIAYGDSSGDRQLLALATEPHWV